VVVKSEAPGMYATGLLLLSEKLKLTKLHTWDQESYPGAKNVLINRPGLPDGSFSNQKSVFG
jgi:hypothetical protein